MLVQPRYEPFGASSFFADGMAMRAEVAGTVARDDVLGSDVSSTGERSGRDAERIPIHVTRSLLAEGRESFDVVCAACHGPLGDGRSVVASKMQDRRPPSLHDPAIASLAPGRMFRVLTEGYGLMMSVKDVLTVEQRWAVVAYVGVLVLSQSVDASILSEQERARLEAHP
jgi:mono/diheme cytochrome c family protein